MDKINKIENDIKNLVIQGATNVAIAVIEGIKCGNTVEMMKQTGMKLAYARPTEPLAQNALKYIFAKENQSIDYYLTQADIYLTILKKAKEKMISRGVEVIKENSIYLTHCHSSSVVQMFILAHKMGLKFKVFATETRPLYQGHITVSELLKNDINVTLIVDDVAISLLEDKMSGISGVFIGADLLGSDGFINKVGSLGISLSAARNNIPLFVSSILLKYSDIKYTSKLLEARNPDEVWPSRPVGLSIYAPAFDYIAYAKSSPIIITEAGRIKPFELQKNINSLYPFLKEDYAQ